MVMGARKIQSSILLMAISCCLLIGSAVMAANYEVERKSAGAIAEAAIMRGEAMAFGDQAVETTGDRVSAPRALGSSFVSPSPGVVVGDTWFEYQRNGSMRRMVGVGPHSGETGDAIVHFHWMYMADVSDLNVARTYAYIRYNSADASFLGSGPVTIQPYDSTEYGGYVSGDVTKDNRYVAAGHNNLGSGNDIQVYWDGAPGAGTFTTSSRVPDSLGVYPYHPASSRTIIWPAVAYQETGATPVTHVVGYTTEQDGSGTNYAWSYFRKVGDGASGTWDYPPRVVDTGFVQSHDIAASRTSGKVAIAWTANIPATGDCDTCSNNNGQPISLHDNDVYLQWSNDHGSTWEPRVNVTQYPRDVDSYRAYIDLSVLITSDDYAAVVWNAREWPASCSQTGTGDCGLLRGKLFFWSEALPSGVLRTVYDARWDQTTCNGGVWQLNVAKMQLSECDNKLYCVWAQFNNVPAGIEDDCRTLSGGLDYFGAANGELYMAVSDDDGLTWDDPRNLTNSYTPNCPPGVDCGADMWPSVSRYGRQEQPGEDWSGATVVDPSGSYTGDRYLDVQYIQDGDPGGAIQGESSWQPANVAWFRLACVEPELTPDIPVLSPSEIDYPSWSKHGVQVDTTVYFTNPNNFDLSVSYNPVEFDGPSGWLSVSPTSDVIPSGLDNMREIHLTLNPGGFINNPGTIVRLGGGLEIVSNAAGSPDTLFINHWVADTVVAPQFDTISTGVVSLVVNSAGNFGNQGRDSVSMDFADEPAECDPTAETYLFDGSPVIGWIDGADTVMNWSIYGDSWLDPNGFVPVGHVGDFEAIGFAGDTMRQYEASFMTKDSSVCIEKTWWAPYSGDIAGVDVGHFYIQRLRVALCGSEPRTLLIGEVVDWDIPSDSAVDNGSTFDDTRDMIWQYGGEYNQDNATECQDNDTRFGAIGYLQGDAQNLSGYTADNATYVLPTGGLVPGQMYFRMFNSFNFELFSSPSPDSFFVDLHTVMVYTKNALVDVGDTLEFYSVILSIREGSDIDVQQTYDDAHLWMSINLFNISCCIGSTRGDVNGDLNEADPVDLAYLVDFLFSGGTPPVCPEEADLNGDDIDGDPVDLSYLVDFLFAGGPVPVPCGSGQ